MYFTPQQLSGGPKYNPKTRVGNWSEDQDANSTKIMDYMQKKEGNQLRLNLAQQKVANGTQRVSLL